MNLAISKLKEKNNSVEKTGGKKRKKAERYKNYCFVATSSLSFTLSSNFCFSKSCLSIASSYSTSKASIFSTCSPIAPIGSRKISVSLFNFTIS